MGINVKRLGLSVGGTAIPPKSPGMFAQLALGQYGRGYGGDALWARNIKVFDPILGEFVPLPGAPSDLYEQPATATTSHCEYTDFTSGETYYATWQSDYRCISATNPSVTLLDVDQYLMVSDAVPDVIRKLPGSCAVSRVGGSYQAAGMPLSFNTVQRGNTDCFNSNITAAGIAYYDGALAPLGSLEFIDTAEGAPYDPEDVTSCSVYPSLCSGYDCTQDFSNAAVSVKDQAYTLLLSVDFDIHEGGNAGFITESAWAGTGYQGLWDESSTYSVKTFDRGLIVTPAWGTEMFIDVTASADCSDCGGGGTSSVEVVRPVFRYGALTDPRLGFNILYNATFQGQPRPSEAFLRSTIQGFSNAHSSTFPGDTSCSNYTEYWYTPYLL